uniref:CRISPR-associated endonuclease Cas3 n=1 Tax=Thermofilum pendens TaxID=2269 RepID=A0A7J3X8T9_THEPE
MNIVYAYYEPPHTQTMEEHVRLALEAFRESSTLVRFGQSLSPAFHTLLKLGLLLHDFGKALFPLRGTKLSFTGHEVVSGWMVYRLVEGFGSGRILERLGVERKTDESGALVLAVMLHHHPMDFTNRLEKLAKSGTWCELRPDHVRAFAGSVSTPAEEHLSLSKDELEKLLLEALGQSGVKCSVICGAVKEIYGILWRRVWLGGASSSRRFFLLLLQGIVAADYKASQSRKSGAPLSRFARAVDIFMEHYSGVSGAAEGHLSHIRHT